MSESERPGQPPESNRETKHPKRLWLELVEQEMKERGFTNMFDYIKAQYFPEKPEEHMATPEDIGFPSIEDASDVFYALTMNNTKNIEELPYLDGGPDHTGSHYRKLKRIDAGGMGKIEAALDERTGRVVAIKILHEDKALNERFVKRFAREALALSKSSTSPFIVKVLDVVDIIEKRGAEHPQNIGIVMEYIRGKDLFTVQKDATGGKKEERYMYNEWTIASIATQIACALRDAHDAGIIHRDLKQENVLITPLSKTNIDEVRIHVSDFGIAQLKNEIGESTPTPEEMQPALTPLELKADIGRALTPEKSALGTPEYISPEAVVGESVDARSDLYSLGIILYRMLSGKLPFYGGNRENLLRRHRTEIPWPPLEAASSLRWKGKSEELLDDLENITIKLMKKKPENRYQTALEVAQAIKEAVRKIDPKKALGFPYQYVADSPATTSSEEKK